MKNASTSLASTLSKRRTKKASEKEPSTAELNSEEVPVSIEQKTELAANLMYRIK